MIPPISLRRRRGKRPMARKKVLAENPEQMELIPECSDKSRQKLRKLLSKMDSLDEAKKKAREAYDAAEQDVIAFVRDEEKIMPDKDGNYRIRLDADETICISRGKSKVKVNRVRNAEDETGDDETDEDLGNDAA